MFGWTELRYPDMQIMRHMVLMWCVQELRLLCRH
nr:MAG TPA_asm: hypothetical protein [Caudoviricetes sp.]